MLNKATIVFVLVCLGVGLVYLPAVISANGAAGKYSRADACYKKLRNDARGQKYRDRWMACIELYEAVYRHDPTGPWAAAGLYRAANLYWELYLRSRRTADKQESADLYQRIINRFPRSGYNKKSLLALKEMAEARKSPGPQAAKSKTKESRPAADPPAPGDKAGRKPPATTPSPTHAELSTVTKLRYWSNPSYTRVVVDLDADAEYTHKLLGGDSQHQKPQRLYVDLAQSRLGKDAGRTIPINDNLLTNARAAQNTPDSVRVVVDIKSFKTYKIFALRDPSRIVIDVWGRKKTAPPALSPQAAAKASKGKSSSTASLARQLALGVRRIVIDPGHGGKDFGAPGYIKGVHEKHVTLSIAKTMARKLRKKLGFEVLLTRTTDRYMTLEERTAFANMNNADLFISIHTNSARSRRAYGIETYFLNLATDDEAIRVAAMENATSKKNISDLQSILNDLMQSAKINESSRLAGYVQTSTYRLMRKRYTRIKDKGVKQAPFYVLLGAQMPSILIETSFISNPRECKRLIDRRYQNHLSDGVISGIRSYIDATKPSAARSSAPKKAARG